MNEVGFLDRVEVQEGDGIRVRTAVPSRRETKALFSSDLYRKGYADLVRAATAVLNPEGLLACTFVTRHLTRDEFVAIMKQASSETGASLQVLESHGLPPDHPTRASHPEGRYLNFVVCAIRR